MKKPRMPNRFMPVLLQIDWLLQTNVGNIERACDKGRSFNENKREKKLLRNNRQETIEISVTHIQEGNLREINTRICNFNVKETGHNSEQSI